MFFCIVIVLNLKNLFEFCSFNLYQHFCSSRLCLVFEVFLQFKYNFCHVSSCLQVMNSVNQTEAEMSFVTCGAEGGSRWGSCDGSSPNVSLSVCRFFIRRKHLHVLQRNPAGILLGGGGGGLQSQRGGGDRLHLLHPSLTKTPPTTTSSSSLQLLDLTAPLLTKDFVQNGNPVLRDREEARMFRVWGRWQTGGDEEERRSSLCSF